MSTSGKHTFHAPNITFFTGRETFLHTLRETLLHKQAATIVGARGVGKTAAAQEYVRRFAQQYRRVFWINAATAETFLCDTLALAWRISLPVDGKLGFANALQMVQSWSTNEQDSLLVLDNVTFPQGATISSAQQLPAGHVVLITHDQDIPPELPCLKLDALDEMDGALLVLRRGGLLAPGATLGQAGHELRTSALELARMLQGSPVALNLAGGYIRESRCSVQDYVLAYRDYPTPSDQPDSAGDEQVRSIEVACGLTLTLLAHRPAAILALARLCSLLYSDYIPVALFEQQAAQSRLVASAHRQQPISLMRAIQHLQICGLLTVDQDRPFLNMHPLIQDALRKTFSQEECQRRITQLLHASQQFMLTREGGAQFIRLCVTGHIRRLAAQSEEGALAGDEVADALNQAASLLWEQGLIRDAEALVQKALAIWERTPGPTRPETATAWLNLTVMNSVLKRYDRAEEMAQRAIVATTEALGVDHPDVLLALNILGNIFQQQGKQQNAKSSYQEALAIGERVGLQMHAYYFSSMYDLAVLNIERGQLDEARAGLERVCAVWEEAEPERYQVARIHLERLQQATKTPEANYAGYE